jgi:hypothetical protein
MVPAEEVCKHGRLPRAERLGENFAIPRIHYVRSANTAFGTACAVWKIKGKEGTMRCLR